MSVLGDRIRQRRLELQITQEALAEAIDKDQKQIWKYESGRNTPSATVLGQIADELETTTDWLLGRTDDRNRPLRNMDDLDELEREILLILRGKKATEREKYLEIARIV